MFEQLLQDYIEDITVQGVALCLQVNSFNEGRQKNPILNTIFLEHIDTDEITKLFREEFGLLRNIKTVEELIELTQKWFKTKVTLQYAEDEQYAQIDAARVYCYVFFLRCLRKRHRELWKMCQKD